MRTLKLGVIAAAIFALAASAANAETPTNPLFSSSGGYFATPEVSVRPEGEAPPKAKRPIKPGYGGWGGPIVSYMMPMGIFSDATDWLGIDDFPEGVFMVGGMGTGQLGDHFRIGGAGAGGTLYSSSDVLGQERSALIALGYGGLVLYGMYPVNEKIDLYGKILLGAGALSVHMKGDDLPDEYDKTAGFFACHPALGVAYHPVRFMSLELEASYFGMVMPELAFQDQQVIDDGFVGGPMVQLNILFGWKSRAND